MSNKLLIVEDDPGLQKQLKWALKANYELLFAANRLEAYDLFVQHKPSVVLHDLGLPPHENGVIEGKTSINAMLNYNPDTKIIVMTGKGGNDDAVDMIRAGAHDYFNKPVDLQSLKLVIERAWFLSKLEIETMRASPDNVATEMLLPGVVGRSEIMQSVANLVKKVAKTSISVFINGESGTGKDLIARAIHSLSDRSNGPFAAINCAAIPENLLESELFGYEKGAFTGATARTSGKIESAAGGTLFLDEIGDMAYGLQSKILRFLQEKTIQRLGGKEDIAVDVRIISATHQNLMQMIEEKVFRHDLYYRINEIEINIPALVDRQDDIPLLANFFLQHYSKSHGKGPVTFNDGALEAMKKCRWEGNIRQLSNIINKAVIMSDQSQIRTDSMDLPRQVIENSADDCDDVLMTLKDAKNELEKDLVLKALRSNKSNVQLTAKMLGVSRQRIYGIMKKNKIEY
jgi:two-component system NtrC family response regulator